MNFTSFLNLIPDIEKATLGGLEAQLKLAPESRKKIDIPKNNQAYRPAAVMALFYPDKEQNTQLLLTLRASYSGTHSAQVSFPGGKVDITDTDLSETALRECYEEVGIPKEEIQIVKELTDVYIPPSKFQVTPFIAVSEKKPDFILNHEVAKIIEVSFYDLLSDQSISYKSMDASYQKNIQIPYFNFSNHTVWGATAMIISEIKELLKSL